MKVRFNETVSYKGNIYFKDQEYEMKENDVKALGDVVNVIERKKELKYEKTVVSEKDVVKK
jgi:hypothetical protein